MRRLTLLFALLILGAACTATAAYAQGPGDRDGDGYYDDGRTPQDICPDQPGGPGTPGGPDAPGVPQGCPTPPDSDGDGHRDDVDSCPSQPGGAAGPENLRGCPPPPDTDGDGYPDGLDNCPNQPGGPGGPGVPQGCQPPPDSDRDGYPDEQDVCPAEPGGAGGPGKPQGCPDRGPDKDGDGVPDAQDLCPDSQASGSTDGCGVFRALVISADGKDLDELVKDPGDANQAQCYGSRGETCSFRAKLTLDAASAKKLKLRNRTIGDVRITKTTKRVKSYDLAYHNFKWGFSKAEKRALKKAKSVTLTMSGTWKHGSDAAVAFKPVTFKARSDYNPRRSAQVGLDTRVRGEPSDE